MDYNYYEADDCFDDVVCDKCGARKKLGVDKVYAERGRGEEYTDDGSLVPTHIYTCLDCKIQENRIHFNNMALNAIDFSRRLDNLQKDLDTVKQQQITDSKILFKILFVVILMPWVCLMVVYFILF